MKKKKGKKDFKLKITRLALEAFKSTGYLIINKTLIEKFGLVPAGVLSNYIDKHIYFTKKRNEKNKEFNGWFFLTHKDISKHLNIKTPSIRNAKQKFIELGILQVATKGVPAKEWIRIDFQSFISELLDPSEMKRLDPSLMRGLIRRTNINSNNSPLTNQKKEITQFTMLAKFLYKIVSSTRKVSYSKDKMKHWANDIRRLSQVDNIDPGRINKALRWYEKSIGGEFIPVIHSGASLREKFVRLEAAIERDGWGSGKKKELDTQREPSDKSWMK